MGAQPSLYRIQSQLATRQQLDEAPAQRWISEMRTRLVITRKTWERVYLLQALYSHGMLRPDRRGLGFGVGSDPMIPVMVNYGCRVVATDYGSSEIKGWGFGLELNPKGVADPDRFNEMVEVRCVDMNNIPSDLKGFDFIWSCGSLEHIGGLHRGLVFVESAMDCLRPGGVAVHTTELNLSGGARTLGTPTLSFYLPKHINDLAVRLNNAGHFVLPINYQTGNTPDDLHEARRPFDPPCIRIIHSGFKVTSLGITIVAHVERGRKDLSVLPVNHMKSGLEILKQSNIKIPQEPDASGRVLSGIVVFRPISIARKLAAAPDAERLYSRFAKGLKARSPVLFRLGQFTARTLWRRQEHMVDKQLLRKIRKPVEDIYLVPEPSIENCLLGPFARCDHANINESHLAFHLWKNTEAGVMFDVGAHRGSSLLPFARNGWRIYAFEPDIQNRSNLARAVSAFPKVSVDKRAVSDTTERSVPFYSSSESSGISSLKPFTNSHVYAGTVDTVTLTDFCSEQKISHIDLLKIDVESYDLLVLKGVPWDSIKPNVIICEFEDRKTRLLGYTMHDMARYLVERGYKVLVSEWHPVIRYGIKHDWNRFVPYPCELDDPNAVGNLIAFREQPDLQEIATIAKRIVKVDANRTLYQRLVGYLKRNYPAIITINRFAKWSLAILKKTFFGIGGIFLLVIVGLYVAGAFIEPLRWYLVGIASALLLSSGGLLALFYLRSRLNRIVSEQRKQTWDVKSELKSALRKSEAELKKEISNSKNTLAKMNVGNFTLFQRFNRWLTNEDVKRFAEEWVPKLGINLDARALGYIAHRICLAEDTCVGRLGGHIETMLLRVLVVRSVKKPNLAVLEIGTMFGVGVAMIHENCRGFFKNMHFTIIDPLSGFYGKDQIEPMTKIPVTRDIFVHNMQRMNIPEADYTIIEMLSTEDKAIEQASKRRYNVLIIDGDHSYSGAKHDFFNYGYLVKRGGYIIFDDYGKTEWPGVKNFVDNEVVGLPELEFVGTDAYTAVFRVIAPQDSTKRGRKQHK